MIKNKINQDWIPLLEITGFFLILFSMLLALAISWIIFIGVVLFLTVYFFKDSLIEDFMALIKIHTLKVSVNWRAYKKTVNYLDLDSQYILHNIIVGINNEVDSEENNIYKAYLSFAP